MGHLSVHCGTAVPLSVVVGAVVTELRSSADVRDVRLSKEGRDICQCAVRRWMVPLSLIGVAAVPAAVCRWWLCRCYPGGGGGVCM